MGRGTEDDAVNGRGGGIERAVEVAGLFELLLGGGCVVSNLFEDGLGGGAHLGEGE